MSKKGHHVMGAAAFERALAKAEPGEAITYISAASSRGFDEAWARDAAQAAMARGRGVTVQRRRADGGLDYVFQLGAG